MRLPAQPRIFSYVITHDTGFAPNPYGGFYSLAMCKPRIRATARVGDWVLATGSARAIGRGRLVCAARISEVVTLEDYGNLRRFAVKRPSATGEPWKRHGDNIYFRNSSGQWQQRRNIHHKPSDQEHDLSGKNVLISTEYWYFGGNAPALPRQLQHLVKEGPGHKRAESQPEIDRLCRWLEQLPQGINGDPFKCI
jgi:hypothetical protein